MRRFFLAFFITIVMIGLYSLQANSQNKMTFISAIESPFKALGNAVRNVEFNPYGPSTVAVPGYSGFSSKPVSTQSSNTTPSTQTPITTGGLNTLNSNLDTLNSGSTGSVDPATQAAYNQAISNYQAAIGRIPSQLQSGYGAIDTSYQNALNQLLLGKNQSTATYNQNKQSTAKDYVGAKNTLGSQAGTSLNALQRLLGSRGAGGSSAYLQAVPQAVARGASLQRADVANQFGANNQSLDTSFNNYLTDYGNQVASAGSQKDQQRQSLEQQTQTNQASLLQSLASLQAQLGNGTAAQSYLDQANALLDKTSNYTTAPINYNTTAYTPPSIDSYNITPNPLPGYSASTPTNDYFSPYLQSLLGKKLQIA